MQNDIENEREHSSSTLEYRIDRFDYTDGNAIGEYKNILDIEKGQYLEPLINKSVIDPSLFNKIKFPNYFIISFLGMVCTFIYEIMALFRIFTLFHMESVPSMSLLNRVKSFELFFSASAFLYIFFIILMYHGLNKSINNKWIKMCIYVGKLAGKNFVCYTKNCILNTVYESFQDVEQSKKFGNRFIMALEYAIDQFESDVEGLSECSKYVWNKNKYTLYKIRIQSVILPVFVSTIAHLVLSAYIYHIAKFHSKIPLGHPILITEFRWFAVIQYKGLLWVLMQFSMSLLLAFLSFKNDKNVKNIIEKHFETSLSNANYFGYDLINKVWGRDTLMNEERCNVSCLKSVFCNICINDRESLELVSNPGTVHNY